MNTAIQTCVKILGSRRGGYACFVNVHSLTESRDNPKTRIALEKSTYAFPDGVPLVWASSLKGEKIIERVCGPDFMCALLRACPGETFGFIGGKVGQAERIAERFGVRSISYSPPHRPFEEEAALEDWERFKEACLSAGQDIPKCVWVCLGAPKQELWMQTVSTLSPETLFFGVGAAIDFLAGEKRRAPRGMQTLGLEWFFRFVQEPRRLGPRYFSTNSRFILAVFVDLFRR
jgi:N-acetylglucosaminyldiphosphoundecaprenol N-acetyl-beta-D-mannosaminyltransferase